MTDLLLKATTDNYYHWLYTIDSIKCRYSVKDYQKILTWARSCARDVKEEDIVAYANSDFDLNGFKTGVFFTNEYMYGPHTKPIYLYDMKSVTLDKSKKKEVTFTVTYESGKITGHIKGIWAGAIVRLLQTLTGYSKVLSTAEIRQKALTLRNTGKEAEFLELLTPLAETDGESASILAYYYFEKDKESASTYIETAQKLHHPFGYYLAGVKAINKENKLKEGYDYFLKAYELGMADIEKDIYDIHTRLSQHRCDFTPVVYEYNKLECNPKILVKNHSDSCEFYDYLESKLQNLHFHITWNSEEKFYAGLYHTFTYAGNSLDYYILDYCKNHNRIGILYMPSMSLQKQFKDVPVKHIFDMKSYCYEHNKEYPSEDPFRHFYSDHGWGIITKVKNASISINKQDNITFIEECILSYETLMADFKSLRAKLLAIYREWNNTDYENQIYDKEKFNRYIEKAQESILFTDQSFLDTKAKFMNQAKLSENDLFRDEASVYEKMVRLAKLKYEANAITEADTEKGLVHFEAYTGTDYCKENVRRLLSKEKQRTLNFDKVLFYEEFTYSVITTDALYLSSINETIPLTNALCCKLTNSKQFVLVYKDLTQKVYNCSSIVNVSNVQSAIRFINRILPNMY